MTRKLFFVLGSLTVGVLVVFTWVVGAGLGAAALPGEAPVWDAGSPLMEGDGLAPPWENAGIYGATIWGAAYDPTTGYVYLATAGAYYKSVDGGQTWARIAQDGHTAVAVDQVDGTTYLGLAGMKEVWVSTDHGNTWQVQPIFGAPETFAIDPLNRNVAFLGTGEPFTGGAGRVYRSLDRGVTWEFVLVDDGHCISSVAVNPLDENNVWAVSWGCQGLLDYSAVYSSTNRGLSYNLVLTDSNPFEYNQLLFDSSGLLYLAGDDVRISFNGGITFTVPALVGKVQTNMRVMLLNPVTDRVYIITNEGGYHCDGGGVWVPDNMPWLLAIDPNNTDNILAGSGQGVQRSTNGGTTWTQANTGLEQVIVAELAGYAQDASTVYATTHRGTGRSLDGGDTWDFPIQSVSARGLAVSPITSSVAFIGQDRDAWVYSTTNSGGSWFQSRITDTTGYVRQIAMHPLQPNIVYATVSSLPYDPYADTSKDGLYVSMNAGATWENAGLLDQQINAVALGSNQTQVVVYAGEGELYHGLSTGGIWRLDPGSSTWAYKGPENTIISHIAVDPRDPWHLYIGSSSGQNFSIVRGLFESYDGGDTWNWIYPNTYVNLLVIDPLDPDVVYFSDGGGLYRSLDGGSTWNEYDRHPSGGFNALYFSYSGVPTVFAGTGDGIFRRVLGDSTPVQPGLAATLQFTTTEGTTVTVEIPASAFSETFSLLYTEIPNLSGTPPHITFAGHAFSLSAFRDGEKILTPTLTLPLTVTIAYSDADVALMDEGRLRLLSLENGRWVDAACGAMLRNPQENWLQVPICSLGQLGLFQADLYTYLPLMKR